MHPMGIVLLQMKVPVCRGPTIVSFYLEGAAVQYTMQHKGSVCEGLLISIVAEENMAYMGPLS